MTISVCKCVFLKAKDHTGMRACVRIHYIVRLHASSLKQCVDDMGGSLIDSEKAGAEPCLWSGQAVGDGGC